MLRFGRCGLGVHMEQRASPGTVQVLAGTDGSMRDDVWVRLGSWGSLFARWRRKLWNIGKWSTRKTSFAVMSAREGLKISACDPMPSKVYRESQGANLNLVAERRCSWVGIANEAVEMGSCTEQESTVKRSEMIAYTTERQ